jgi:HD-GYP domain-containing protein (c-di-GMP phosphodiesterase class II)
LPAAPSGPQISRWFDAVVIIGRKITDRRAHAHNLRVARLCVHIGRQLSMSAKELRLLARAGLLHELGKSGAIDVDVDRRALPERLDWQIGATGDMALITIERPGQSGRELRAILYHHERLDGSGFPYGLIGEAIPIEARILGVADTYDELISGDADRRPLTVAQACRHLQNEAGTRFDARVVAALLAALGRRRAKVGRPTRRVLVF